MIRKQLTRSHTEVLTHILSHLPPSSLDSVALVSRRFHGLVTTPHAWRTAFSRFFPGPDALVHSSRPAATKNGGQLEHHDEIHRSEQRVFTRLTAKGSWRSEYILRTRLLRSLARGKPIKAPQRPTSDQSPRSNPAQHYAPASATYRSTLYTNANHLHALFNENSAKRMPRFICGSDELGTACITDPNTRNPDRWGFTDPQSFLQFSQRFPGDAHWGLGAGEVVGAPNVMDLSQPFGLVYGEGSPGGLTYFRSTSEMRGRFLAFSMAEAAPELGIPNVSASAESVCSVWIAKSSSFLSLTDGLIGILSGTSLGILSAYSMGNDGLRDHRLGRGELTARWAISPGVPIIAIAVDDSYSHARRTRNRVWAVVLNALGEVFCLRDFPNRRVVTRGVQLDGLALDRLAWATGRSVYWTLVESTRRKARLSPYENSPTDDSPLPRSSCDGMNLNKDLLVAETRSIEAYLAHKPHHFRKACEGWDMRRRLEVDFAGDDGRGAGESIFVIGCGLDEEGVASIKRFSRCQIKENHEGIKSGFVTTPPRQASPTLTSIFGTAKTAPKDTPSRSSSTGIDHGDGKTDSAAGEAEWRTTIFSMDGARTEQITATAIDLSRFARLTAFEDALFNPLGVSEDSSPSAAAAPLCAPDSPSEPTEVPGQRGRLLAVGTNNGTVLVWNMRTSPANNAHLINTLTPIRVIHSKSPQISSIALTALYLVHGGIDGLVQAWDPLASTLQPIRTLNSRFSNRALRGLVRDRTSAVIVGAVCLDTDPTLLRGMIALGSNLRYWSYSSTAADQYASRKRRLRRSTRGSNSNTEKYMATARGHLNSYIVGEKLELEMEKERRRREADRLAGRFGVGLLGGGESEEELLAYARMLSEEAFAKDEERRRSGSDGVSDESAGAQSSQTMTPEGGSACDMTSPSFASQDDMDEDMIEAIRLSLSDASSSPPTLHPSTNPPADIPIKYVKSRSSPSSSPRQGPASASSPSKAKPALDSDLGFALQLSLAEEQSRVQAGTEAFPKLSQHSPDGKGKRRMS